jgi:hypothetical protein
MSLPTTMAGLIDQYAAEGNRAALLGIRASQAQQLVDLERTKHQPDKLDRSRSIEEFGNYFRENIAYIDRTLEKMP